MTPRPPLPLGARLEGDRATFCVWAPAVQSVELVLDHPRRESVAMRRDDDAYFTVSVTGVRPGQRYGYRLDGGDVLPDPATRDQPDGVHGLSAVYPTAFEWTRDDWTGLPLDQYVLYELHVGTFTAEGTLDAAARRLPALRDLGISVVELMPLAQFTGARNWGYDGVHPFAVQNTYGGPAALKRFVDACHNEGLGVCLDVVYNHLGPDGNHLARFGPYFTDRYRIPWGDALNFDGPDSDHVREYFIASALQWVDEFRIDALRLDAIHAIVDTSAYRFLRELADRVHARAEELGRQVMLIAESDLADPHVVRPSHQGGLGMDAQWLDDFHHAIHVLLTGERDGYYQDYGDIEQLARAYARGYVYAGEYSPYRRRRHGAPASDIAPERFVVFIQNHDQIGNRMLGDRLTVRLSPEQNELAAAALLLSPFTPLLFMGEEYGETAPFPYFVSHTDEALAEAVRRGRSEEFASFRWAGEPPDPQAPETFESARVNWSLRDGGEHARRLALYRELLRARHELQAMRPWSFDAVETSVDTRTRTLCVTCTMPHGASALYLHFGDTTTSMMVPAHGSWRVRLDTAAARRSSSTDVVLPGNTALELAPWSAVLLLREGAEA